MNATIRFAGKGVELADELGTSRLRVDSTGVHVDLPLQMPSRAQPAAPAAGLSRVWWDDAAKLLRLIDSAGTVTTLGATTNAGALTSGNLSYARLPTGSGTWDVGAGNSLTLTRALTAAALVTAQGGLAVTGGAFAAGRLYKDAARGTVLVGQTGTINDVSLFSAAGSLALGTLTGTINLHAPGKLNLGGGTLVNEQLRITYAGAADAGLRMNNSDGGAGSAVLFLTAGVQVGSVVTSGAATTYNTSSDRQLKKRIKNLDGVLDIIRTIRVRSFEFKAEPGNRVDGFIAQELYEVYPQPVTRPRAPGEVWQIDHSKLVPLLLRCAQELDDRLTRVEAARNLPNRSR